MNLQGKTALVTGGGTGIGLESALALAQGGCRVAIAGRRADVLERAVANRPSRLLHHVVDVADRETVDQLFAWADEQLGQIDILVNSAGTNVKTRTMTTMTPEQWDHIIQVNTTGIYNCMYAVLPQMRQRKDGLIINISSIAGLRASQLGGVAYTASKSGMSALGKAVSNELGGEGIRVTTVYPGEVNTPLLEQRPNPVSNDHKAAILQPEDVGQLVVAIANLPARAHIPEVIIKPAHQLFT